MQWLAAPTGKRGRCQKLSDAAIQFCLTIKCLFGQPLRQTLGLVQSLLRMAGLLHGNPKLSADPWASLSINSTYRYQKKRLLRRFFLIKLVREI